MMWNQNTVMEGFGWFGGGGAMFLGPVVMIGFWVLVIYLIVLVVRWFGGRADPSSLSRPSPLDILKQRYARGEIDEHEYTQSKEALLK